MLIRFFCVLPTLCVAAFKFIMTFASDSIQDATFRIFEHPEAKTLVGNIFQAVRLQTTVKSVRLDSVETEWLKLFHLDRATGNLYTNHLATNFLDRETICPVTSRNNADLMTVPKCVIHLLASINNKILIKINIIIEDLNDNRPKFSQTGEVESHNHTKREGSLVHTVVIDETNAINATQIPLPVAFDLDESGTQQVFYYLFPTTAPFELVHHHASRSHHKIEQLYLVPKEPLDFENITDYWMNLTACDGEIQRYQKPSQHKDTTHCTSQAIHLVIRNRDDEIPIFVKKNYSIIVKDSISIGNEIVTVKAIDSDTSPFNQVNYELIFSSSVYRELFQIDRLKGEIRLAKPIIAPGIYRFHVLATSQSTFNSSYITDQLRDRMDYLDAEPNIARVTLHVIDANNHAPIVSLQSSKDTASHVLNTSAFLSTPSIVFIQLPENTPTPRTLIYFRVTDSDDADNGRIKCELNAVTKDLQNLSIYLIKRDFTSYFELNKVSQLTEHVTIFRLILNQSIDVEQLIDPQRQTYHVSWHNSDLRAVGLAQIEIRCKDHGDPFQSGAMLLNVVILDEDEYMPQIRLYLPNQTILQPTQQQYRQNPTYMYNISLKENFPVGSTMCLLSIMDKDVISKSIIKLRGAVSFVQLNQSTGEFILAKQLDFETNRSHQLSLILHEYQNVTFMPVKLTAVIQILIEDVNDNAPVFTDPPLMNHTSYQNPYYRERYNIDGIRLLHVSEELPEDTHLGQMKAVDRDTGLNAELQYVLIDTSVVLSKNWTDSSRTPLQSTTLNTVELETLDFSIDKAGFIWCKNRLDREITAQIDLLVGVFDLGNPSFTSYTSLRIVLTDINDHEPQWQFPTDQDRLVIVPLYTEVGSIVTRIRAVDPDDSQHNGRVSYSLLPLNETFYNDRDDMNLQGLLAHAVFTVNRRNGEVVLKKSIDALPNGFLDIWVFVTDHGINKQLYSVSKLITYLSKPLEELHYETLLTKYQDRSQMIINKLKSTKSMDRVLSLLSATSSVINGGHQWNRSKLSLPLLIGGLVTGLMLLLISIASFILWKLRKKNRVRKKYLATALNHLYTSSLHVTRDCVDNTKQNGTVITDRRKQDRIDMGEQLLAQNTNKKRSDPRFTLSLKDHEHFANGTKINFPLKTCSEDSADFERHFEAKLKLHTSNPDSPTPQRCAMVNGSETDTTPTFIPVNSFIKFPSTIPLKIVPISTSGYPLNACLSESDSEQNHLKFPNIITSIVPMCPLPPDFIPVCCSQFATSYISGNLIAVDRSKHELNGITNCTPQFLLTANPIKDKLDSISNTKSTMLINHSSTKEIFVDNATKKDILWEHSENLC